MAEDLVERAVAVVNNGYDLFTPGCNYWTCQQVSSMLAALFAEAARREREACAKLADGHAKGMAWQLAIAIAVAADIRARGEHS